MMAGRTFEEVLDSERERAELMLPDVVVHMADMRMTNEGHLTTPGMPRMRLANFAESGLASLLGVRWKSWFGPAISGEERADEVNRRLARPPGEIKVRAWKDTTGEAEGVARAFLSPRFTPIDNLRVFQRRAVTLNGALAQYVFTRVVHSEATSHFSALHTEARDVRGDTHHPGWSLRNSEVGAAALTIDVAMMRLACPNDLLVQTGGKHLLYRTHRSVDDDHLAAAMVIALSKLPERWDSVVGMLMQARDVVVPHLDAAVAAVLDSPEVPKALVEEAQTVALKENDRTRHGVVQAITFVAHTKNTDPDVRFAMERLAGGYLSAA